MKRLLRRIADVQARLILALLYYTVLAPFALAVRFAGRRPPRGWQRRGEPEPPERAWRQY